MIHLAEIDVVLAQSVWDLLTRNWALISIVTTLAVLAVTPTLILRKYVRLSFNIFAETPAPPSLESIEGHSVPLEGTAVDFRAFDGHALRGVLHRGKGLDQPRGMVIFAHEFGSSRRSCGRYCRFLIDAGYDVFSFDFRGQGESAPEEGYRPRLWPSDREMSDMVGAIAYVGDLLEAEGRPRRVGLFGISRGGGAAILAAQGMPGVAAIVTDGAFSTDATLEHVMKRWACIFAKVRVVYENHPPAFWRFLRWLLIRECSRTFNTTFPSVRKAIGRLRGTPILLIHGERDSWIPVAQSQLLYSLAAEPKYLWIVPGAKHNQSVLLAPRQYAERIAAFFDKHLADGPRGGGACWPLRRDAMTDLSQPLAHSWDLPRMGAPGASRRT